MSSSTDLAKQVASLSTAEEQKELLGNKIFPLVLRRVNSSDIASKVTGTILEASNDEICHLIESESMLNARINEALAEIGSCEP
jgi:hypothetical protein